MRPLHPPYNLEESLKFDTGNASLWYDKFCDQWKSDFSKLKDQGKIKWINQVTAKPCGDKTEIEQAGGRIKDLLAAHGQKPHRFRTDGPFVTGLGRSHPVENGFAWHHTLGVPYLPGAGVKGMVRAWVEQWQDDKETAARIFGPKGDTARKELNIGSVIFIDALPVAPVSLKADVMTPHYAPYYQDRNGGTSPADWHTPTPIPFLVVAREQTFQFGVLPRRPSDPRDIEDCKTATKFLKEALAWIGAGAKTAVGYGRMIEVPESVEPASARSSPERSPKPMRAQHQFKTGDKVDVIRTEDPNGKGRVWFQATDGFGGIVVHGTPPEVEIGATTSLWVDSANAGYNFRTEPPPPAKKKRIKNHDSRKKGGQKR